MSEPQYSIAAQEKRMRQIAREEAEQAIAAYERRPLAQSARTVPATLGAWVAAGTAGRDRRGTAPGDYRPGGTVAEARALTPTMRRVIAEVRYSPDPAEPFRRLPRTDAEIARELLQAAATLLAGPHTAPVPGGAR